MTPIDAPQRAQATDPASSFIVQAPAGSGKTEILTQRYLRLLSTVNAPEQIVALTFTRKAASEMRERIIHALQQAAANQPARSEHQQTTLNYAKQALKHSEQQQWNILQHSNRFKIMTIDALCQSINQSIPLLEQQIAYAAISETPEHHYQDAARQCILFALDSPEYQEAIKTLLLHVDNRQELLIQLLQGLLAQRDQWLSPLLQARQQQKSDFEEALSHIEQHELERLKNSLPQLLTAQLRTLVQEVVLIENNPNSARYALRNWQQGVDLNQELAQGLCALLLTSESTYRKSFDHHVGLKSDSCPKEQYRRLKEDSKALLEQLQGYPDFLQALLQVSTLPHPEYDPEQWNVLQALFALLPLLVGHLHLLFAKHNEVDFTTIAQQALQALGDEEQPTDLALYLDHAIHHLLIDEFQDTSITQFELLQRLVQGWQQGDGKTLFIVGDPMQSIYRFRQAEVGLFFRAKQQGIGPVPLHSLELRCNFRSTTTIVHWINQHFATIFPQHVDMESGAVSFYPSTPVQAKQVTSYIHAIECDSKQEEAQQLIQKIQEELIADDTQNLAILVRSRSQLGPIIQLLRQYNIAYQGVDIDCLAELMHLRDVWSVTQALLMPGNRLAWLSVLRSPYCGIALNDLHRIAQVNKKKSIYEALLQIDKIEGLSDDARIRAHYVTQVLHEALLQRAQCRLSDWIRQTLKNLHINQLLTVDEYADLEQYWALIDRYEEQGTLLNINEFLEELNTLYSQHSTPSRLQIMTIHKSKGLEFDTVFLPSLGSAPKHGDEPLLRWLQVPTPHKNLLLLSPMKAAEHEECALYNYLKALDAEKNHYESQRVLYVAATRAKSRLYLLDNSTKQTKKSFRSLLKHQEFITTTTKETDTIEESKPLRKLPSHYYVHPIEVTKSYANPKAAPLSSNTARLIGIVTHRLLQWLCDKHPRYPEEIPWLLVRRELKKYGFFADSLSQAEQQIAQQIHRMYEDPIGLWLLSPQNNEHNEYELLIEHNERTVTRIIDRIFETSEHLWIVDFKTGKDEEIQVEKHQKQLNEYAHYLTINHNKPIHCGLYYLNNNHWITWNQ